MSETGNWNIAGDFVKEKIAKFMIDSDKYEKIARFGVGDMIENYITTEEQRTSARIAALEWFYNEISMLIRNTTFAVRSKSDKELMEEYKTGLASYEKFFNGLSYTTYNQKTKKNTLHVNEEKFRLLLDAIVDIKEKINFPLNRSHLIFHHEEQFDPRTYKTNLKERLATQA